MLVVEIETDDSYWYIIVSADWNSVEETDESLVVVGLKFLIFLFDHG